ncbi:RNA 3'-terminal phosphate cyclase [Agrocybe pediades]|nr:RNA 3'-terminal phosphate cyclase [Agrocybe pediades]
MSLIDGSVLEGGGQILRNAVSLSGLLSKPISIQKIRNNRSPPGLRNQHRTGRLELAAKIASAQLTGAQNGSSEIEFIPGHIALPNHYTADSITAGSITLLLQVALPLLLFSPKPVPASTLTLLGGTNATMAPQVDYTKHVFLPFIQRHFGATNISLDINKRGYYPKGGGEVVMSVVPLSGPTEKLRSFSLMERGRVKWISGIAHYAGLPTVVGKGMVEGAERRLAEAGFSKESMREPNSLTRGAGSGIVLWAELEGGGMIGGSAVGTKGVPPEKVGEQAADELIKGLMDGGCVDEWLQDQIIIFMALADGTSEVNCGKVELSLHTRTAIWLAEQLTEAKFEVVQSAGQTVIRCQGIGYTAPASSS